MLKKGLKMHHMVQKTPWPSGKAKVCNTSIPGPIPGGASKKAQDTKWCPVLFSCISNELGGSDVVRIRFGPPAGAQRRADFRVAFSIYWFLTGF